MAETIAGVADDWNQLMVKFVEGGMTPGQADHAIKELWTEEGRGWYEGILAVLDSAGSIGAISAAARSSGPKPPAKPKSKKLDDIADSSSPGSNARKQSKSKKSQPKDTPLHENQIPDNLESELREAAALGVKPRLAADAIGDLAGQRIKWAVTENGDLMVMPHSKSFPGAIPQEVSHAVLTGGKPAQALGEAFIKVGPDGKLTGEFISSHSGHYFKDKSEEAAAALPIGEALFEGIGITFARRYDKK